MEFWLARDPQHLPGYTEWRNFTVAISKARTAFEMSNRPISDHFVDVNKMVDLGSGSQREVSEVERGIATEEKKSLKTTGSPDS